MQGNGVATSSGRFNSIASTNFGLVSGRGSAPANFGTSIINIFNYSSSSTFKTFLCKNANDMNGFGTTDLRVGLWRNTAALNYIQLGSDGTFDSGSTAALYGVRRIGQ